MTNSEVYRHPRYYALGYRWQTEAECDFIQACLAAHGPGEVGRPLDSDVGATAAVLARGRPERASLGHARDAHPEPVEGRVQRVEGRLLDIGCGAGRHALELARRGAAVQGIDLSPEMVAYVSEAARTEGLDVTVSVANLRDLHLEGPFAAAWCFMDTFRFLLTNGDIVEHLRRVAAALVPGGLYLTDFWVPRQWDQIGSEIHQWEQTENGLTVRVFYLQHPESADPVSQTFEDELVLEIHEGGTVREIRGGRTKTRLLMPQEFRALVAESGVFDLLGSYSDFDLAKPLAAASMSWRMVSVLKRR